MEIVTLALEPDQPRLDLEIGTGRLAKTEEVAAVAFATAVIAAKITVTLAKWPDRQDALYPRDWIKARWGSMFDKAQYRKETLAR